jgi:hypothetical protein
MATTPWNCLNASNRLAALKFDSVKKIFSPVENGTAPATMGVINTMEARYEQA